MAEAAGSLGLMSYNMGAPKGTPPPKTDGEPQQPRTAPSPNMVALKSLGEKSREVGDELGQKLQLRFEEWMLSRRYIEEDWLKYVRAYNGVYEPEILQQLQVNQSKVFVQLTRMKADTSYNRISDLLFGPELHWDVKPSPMPELTPEREGELRAIIAENMAFDPAMMGEQPPQSEELERVEEDIAKKACKKMKLTIRDQLEKVHYETKSRSCIFEMCVVGTGCIKGPMVAVETTERYKQTENGGDWELTDDEDVFPKMEAPSIFDLYPDPYALNIGKGLGVFERHVLRKDQVQRLAKQPFFDKEKVKQLLMDYSRGNHWDSYTDIELRFVSGQSVTGEPERRYDVIEYWGWIDGDELLAAGLKADKIDEHKSYYCNIWHSGGITIRATISPNKPTRQMYKLIPYKQVQASMWGVGVPFLMKDSQAVVNSAARELINNAALSSGPQVEVSIDLIELDANEDIRTIDPWRVWPRSGGDLAYPAVRFTNVPNTTEAMAKIIQIWRAFADEETNIPSYTHGSQNVGGAAGKTASGMSMMMGAASMDIKGVVKNWDQFFVKPFIEEMYHFNMQWSDDNTIKGDMEPDARGSTSLLAKEIKSQRVVMFLEMTNNPTDQAIMGPERRAKLLRAGAEAMDIDPDNAAPDPDEEMVGMGMPMPGGGGMPGMAMPVPGTGGPGQTASGQLNKAGGGIDATPGGPGMNQAQPSVAPATGQVSGQ